MRKKKEVTNEDPMIMCYDSIFGIHFKSSMNKVYKAKETMESRIKNHEYVSFNDFYHELNLPGIPIGDSFKIDYIKVMHDSEVDGEPHLVISYVVTPVIYLTEKLKKEKLI